MEHLDEINRLRGEIKEREKRIAEIKGVEVQQRRDKTLMQLKAITWQLTVEETVNGEEWKLFSMAKTPEFGDWHDMQLQLDALHSVKARYSNDDRANHGHWLIWGDPATLMKFAFQNDLRLRSNVHIDRIKDFLTTCQVLEDGLGYQIRIVIEKDGRHVTECGGSIGTPYKPAAQDKQLAEDLYGYLRSILLSCGTGGKQIPKELPAELR